MVNSIMTLENPLENYVICNQFNVDYFIDQWNEYIDNGIAMIKTFLESILPEFDGLGVEYVPYWEGVFLPWFKIRINEYISHEYQRNLWHKIYKKMEKFAIENGIVPAFDEVNFALDYKKR